MLNAQQFIKLLCVRIQFQILVFLACFFIPDSFVPINTIEPDITEESISFRPIRIGDITVGQYHKFIASPLETGFDECT